MLDMKFCGLIKACTNSFFFFLTEKQFPIKIKYPEYQQQLTTDKAIQVTALCHVEDGIQVLVQRNITLDDPAIDIQVNFLCCNCSGREKGKWALYEHFLPWKKCSAHILPRSITASHNTSSSDAWKGSDRKDHWEPGLTSIFFAQVLGEAKVNKEVVVEVSFTNPINTEVKDCVLQVEGSDLLQGILELR